MKDTLWIVFLDEKANREMTESDIYITAHIYVLLYYGNIIFICFLSWFNWSFNTTPEWWDVCVFSGLPSGTMSNIDFLNKQLAPQKLCAGIVGV